MSKNIALSLSKVAERRGTAPAVIEAASARSISFTDLHNRSDHYAWYLKEAGVRPGDRVMLMVRPSADFICLTFALFKLGAPVILIDPGMGYMNLRRCISGVKPSVFIGVPKAHVFFRLFRSSFTTVTTTFCCGGSAGIFGPDLRQAALPRKETFPVYSPESGDLAAIIFTTGSTGPPKGVRFEHDLFAAQLEKVQNYYGIAEGDVDQPAFPLFALFSTALGASAVIPDMDATKPAKVNPAKFISSLQNYTVSYSFGSPALWKVVAGYCLENGITLPALKKVLMAGAPVSGELLSQMQTILAEDAEIHIPYGATESLPIVSIEAREVVAETWQQTCMGRGTCVGRSLPGITVKIIKICDEVIAEITDEMICEDGEIGEIVVSGDVVTRAYDNNIAETRMAKTFYKGDFYHRLGDTGYLDDSGRLWFCGRKAHRVYTGREYKYSVCCEAIVNNHADIFRSALVGIGNGEGRVPVLILEKEKSSKRSQNEILEEVKLLAAASKLTKDIEYFLFHHRFPVDIRHNAKIFREKLSVWAEKKLVKKV